MPQQIMDNLDLLHKHSLFYGLTQDELEKIQPFLQRKIFPSHTKIIEEGEHSTDIYLLAQGEVNVLKWDDEHQVKSCILRVGPGEMFGEMSFVDASPRSSTIETTQNSIIYQLSRQELELNKQSLGTIYNKILTNIAKISIERLRLTNKRMSLTLKNALADSQTRLDGALSVLYLGVAMSVGKLLTFMNMPFFKGNQELINWGFWVFLLVPVILLIIYYGISRRELGLSFNKPGKSFLETLIFTCLGSGFLYLSSKSMNINPAPHAVLNQQTILSYFLFCILYEFITRGFIQSSLEKAFVNPLWLAPLATAIPMTLVCLTSSQLLWSTIGLSVLGNFLLGLLFARNKDLCGVILAHFILGLLMFF